MATLPKCNSVPMFAFTVTLSPKTRKMNTVSQLYETSEQLQATLSNLGATDITMVAELHKSNDIHYHGCFNWSYPMDAVRLNYLFRNRFRDHKLFGFTMIKILSDVPGWVEYMRKGFADFKRVVQERPIRSDDFHLFTTKEHLEYSIVFVPLPEELRAPPRTPL